MPHNKKLPVRSRIVLFVRLAKAVGFVFDMLCPSAAGGLSGLCIMLVMEEMSIRSGVSIQEVIPAISRSETISLLAVRIFC
jgi:hypothetical protein